MNNLSSIITEYLNYCRTQKCLDEKTLKAYRIDLRQFAEFVCSLPSPMYDGDFSASACSRSWSNCYSPSFSSTSPLTISEITSSIVESYIGSLHTTCKPKTAKRKIASLKALFHYCEYKDIIERNPFSKIRTRFREPIILPKTIPLATVETFLATIYAQRTSAKTTYQRRNALRDAAVIELLFATGIRISELCSLKTSNINLTDGTILIYGKGDKERYLQLASDDVIHTLNEYRRIFSTEAAFSTHFFVNQSGSPLSDQSVRRMINKYCSLAAIDLHITPHMFRHTFATSLLEADVDIRYIQEMLGHSSINVTQIYTHVATAKQRDILRNKHPRKGFRIGDC